MYTRNVNEQVVLGLLKKFGVRKIVASAGTQNFGFVSSAQDDDWFEVYSVVDERSAAYFANGLAFESGEAVVLSCTGATASRNYLPGLTEAYYRKLPIIALTSTHVHPDVKDFSPQAIDRANSQNDVKLFSAELPPVQNEADFHLIEKYVNEALIIATEQRVGPVHLNSITYDIRVDIEELPDVRKVDYYDTLGISKLEKNVFSGKKIGILVGSHRPFEKNCLSALQKFAKKYSAAVFCDHTSNYSGVNKVLISTALGGETSPDSLPDILIDIGSIIGDYNAMKLGSAKEIWRISEDGVFHDRFSRMTKLFNCKELDFFESLHKMSTLGRPEKYCGERWQKTSLNKSAILHLPLSNTYVAWKSASLIPKESFLHLGILNSLRNADLFEFNNVVISSNVGGFGIDGAVSTLIGQSMANPDKLHFGIIGDLAFFYDMNALGIRHIGNNVRLIVVNNGRGVEFRLNPLIESQRGEKIDEFTAGAGHHVGVNSSGLKDWATAMGFEYLSAKTKEEFDNKASYFYAKKSYTKPLVMEVFTTVENEKEAKAVSGKLYA